MYWNNSIIIKIYFKAYSSLMTIAFMSYGLSFPVQRIGMLRAHIIVEYQRTFSKKRSSLSLVFHHVPFAFITEGSSQKK